MRERHLSSTAATVAIIMLTVLNASTAIGWHLDAERQRASTSAVAELRYDTDKKLRLVEQCYRQFDASRVHSLNCYHRLMNIGHLSHEDLLECLPLRSTLEGLVPEPDKWGQEL